MKRALIIVRETSGGAAVGSTLSAQLQRQQRSGDLDRVFSFAMQFHHGHANMFIEVPVEMTERPALTNARREGTKSMGTEELKNTIVLVVAIVCIIFSADNRRSRGRSF
jgi:hypothetical protein